ncbi:MAG: hypothetical protein RLZZ350_1932 [Verrucomicrobiota bacterium]
MLLSGVNAQAQKLKLEKPKKVPVTASFFSMQLEQPPLPFNPFPELPLYKAGKGIFIFDDRSVDYLKLAQEFPLLEASPSTGGGVQARMACLTCGNTNLFLEISPLDTPPNINNQVTFTLYNTEAHKFYELLYNTDLTTTNWLRYGSFLAQDDGSTTNPVIFRPVAVANPPYDFFRARQTNANVSVSGSQTDAVRPATTNVWDTGTTTIFTIALAEGIGAPLDVYFQIGGTATNGVDYYLTDSANNPITNNHVSLFDVDEEPRFTIVVHPLFSTNLTLDLPVTLTLVETNFYSVAPCRSNATDYIDDYLGTNLLYTVVVVTNSNGTLLSGMKGIDFSAGAKAYTNSGFTNISYCTNALMLSVNYSPVPNGSPFNFAWVGTNGSPEANGTNLIFRQWSSVSGLADEVKVAVVQTNVTGQTTNAGGFVKGEMFFGTGVNGVIGKLSTNGSVYSNSWATLTNSTGYESLIRGSLCVDQSGSFGGDLIAVTGNGQDEGGGIYRIKSTGVVSNVVTLANNIHLEGVITVTNDIAKWGPWAGKILTGAESLKNACNLYKQPIFAIASNGAITTNFLEIATEDFDFVKSNQDLYCTVENIDKPLIKYSKSVFTNHVGSLLITQSGDGGGAIARLFIVRWDATKTNFNIRAIHHDAEFEHVTFAPINLPSHKP